MSGSGDNAARSGVRSDGAERHRLAVSRTLAWADDAAARGEYGEALAWLETVQAVDAELPQPYVVKRAAWRRLDGDSTYAV